jgi:hypothetical protein
MQKGVHNSTVPAAAVPYDHNSSAVPAAAVLYDHNSSAVRYTHERYDVVEGYICRCKRGRVDSTRLENGAHGRLSASRNDIEPRGGGGEERIVPKGVCEERMQYLQ